MALDLPPLVTYNQYFEPPKSSAEYAAEQSRADLLSTQNELARLALENAPEEREWARQERQRKTQEWNQKDLEGVRSLVSGYLSAVDTSDPQKFTQSMSVAMPRLAADLHRTYGEKALEDIAYLKALTDQAQDPAQVAGTMQLVDTYRKAIADPDLVLKTLSGKRLEKELGEPGFEEQARIRARYEEPKWREEMALKQRELEELSKYRQAQLASEKDYRNRYLETLGATRGRQGSISNDFAKFVFGKIDELEMKQEMAPETFTARDEQELNRMRALRDAYISQVETQVPAGGTAQAGPTPGSDLPPGVTEEDVQYTMQKHNMSREEVLSRIRNRSAR